MYVIINESKQLVSCSKTDSIRKITEILRNQVNNLKMLMPIYSEHLPNFLEVQRNRVIRWPITYDHASFTSQSLPSHRVLIYCE